jgi:hypothetical protein
MHRLCRIHLGANTSRIQLDIPLIGNLGIVQGYFWSNDVTDGIVEKEQQAISKLWLLSVTNDNESDNDRHHQDPISIALYIYISTNKFTYRSSKACTIFNVGF